jgi:alkylhydroperoxidase/carboxymuconolactone decarboxylase family protein YurZ
MTPNTRHARQLAELTKAIADGEGKLDADLRKKFLDGKAPSSALASFAVKVQENATSITDAHIESLLNAGYSEDQIFECVIASAVGAGVVRVRRVLDLLGGK